VYWITKERKENGEKGDKVDSGITVIERWSSCDVVRREDERREGKKSERR